MALQEKGKNKEWLSNRIAVTDFSLCGVFANQSSVNNILNKHNFLFMLLQCFK